MSERYAADAEPSRALRVAAGVVAAVSVVVFVLIAEDVLDGGGLISNDKAVLAWFVDHRTDALVSVARVVSVLGGFVSLALVAVVVGVVLWRRGWHSILPAAALVLGSLASTAAKAMFDRPRPPDVFHAANVTLAAFPSGHATDAAAFFLATACTLAITVARRRSTQAALVAVGIGTAAVVGLSRLVLGVHWLSDVVAGWALGTAPAVTVFVVFWTVSARTRVDHDA